MSSTSKPRPDKPATDKRAPSDPGSEAVADANVQYDSALKPLLWILIPFALLLIYGFFT